MSYEVWRINDLNASSNTYTTGRTESWNLVRDCVFSDLEEAKEYIKNKSRIFTIITNFLVDLKNEEEKTEFINEFCFGDKYLHHQRFFIGKPSIQKLRKAVESQGIKFILEK